MLPMIYGLDRNDAYKTCMTSEFATGVTASMLSMNSSCGMPNEPAPAETDAVSATYSHFWSASFNMWSAAVRTRPAKISWIWELLGIF